MKELIELTVRIFNDTLPKNSDATFLYSQTPDNQPSVIKAAYQLYKEDKTASLLIMETKAMSGYSGFENFKAELITQLVPQNLIEGVNTNENRLHTLIESLAAVQHCKNKNYKNLIVVAPPFHQIRAFMTAVSASKRLYPELKIYSYSGEAFSWNGIVVHSQGKTQGKRADLIYGEIERSKI